MAKSDNPARTQAAANTRKLIEWAAEAVNKPLPEPVRRRAAIILSDDIGAMVAGSLETQVAKAREGLLRTSSGKTEATVLAQGAPRADRYAAASANGMAITWCELDEGFRNASCHGGAYTIPALLAEAEAQGRSVEEVLRALAVAYEVTTRFALAFPFPVFNVHPHAAFAAIGGAADWAEAGIGGNDVTPYDVFVGAYKTNAKPDALVAGLGDAWSVTNGYHKVFACCGYAHSAIEATLDILGRMQKKKDDIAEILVETAPGGQALRNAEPETVLAAKFSLPHAIAATVRLGTAGAGAFTDDKLRDEGIAKLRERVRLAPYRDLKPWPNDRPARVTLRFGDGAEMSAVCESARGGADNPFDEPTLLSKLAENAGAVFPAVPDTMKKVIAGDKALLAQSWPDALARMLKP